MKVRVLLAATAVVMLLSACGGASNAGTPSTFASLQTTTNLKLGIVSKIATHWPFWEAMQRGFFSAQKLQVETVAIDTDARMTDALIAGSIDVEFNTIAVAYNANQHGGDLQMFCGIQNLPYYRLVAAPSIHAISDLRGKSIGVSDAATGVDSFVAQEWLSKIGLSSGSYSLVNTGGLVTRLAAVRSGATAATLLVPPFDLQAVAAGLTDLGVSTGTVTHFTNIEAIARGSWLRSHSAVAAAFCRAISKGDKYLQDPANKATAMQDLESVVGVKATDAPKLYEALLPEFSRDGTIDVAGLEPWAKYLTPKPTAADLAKIVNTTYIKAAQAG